MKGAARGGHKDLVEFFISKGADDLDMGLYFAAMGGDKDMVDFFIEIGLKKSRSKIGFLGLGFSGAREGGNKNLMNFFSKSNVNVK